MILKNREMERVIAVINESEEPRHNLSELSYVIWPEFIEVSECILMKQNTENPKELNMDHIYRMFGDRTGFEASDSHVHMMDLAKEFELQPLEGVKFALKLLEIWECKLKRDFPQYRFVLILSFDGQDSILRFHRNREEEGSWLNNNDLDGYENTAILVKYVG